MKKYLKKEVIIFLIIVLVLGITIGFSFSYYMSSDYIEDNIATTECFKLSLEDNNDINLDKTYPLSDEEGSNLTPYEFTIRNVCNNTASYQINIETLSDSSISTEYLKYKLNNNASYIIGNQEEVIHHVNNNVKVSNVIETGVLGNNEEKNYSLRLWVDENASKDDTANKVFRCKIVIMSEPSKTQEIFLNTNGGELDNNVIIKVLNKQIGDLPTPVKAGFNFEGWYMDEDFRSEITPTTVVIKDLNQLFAKWNERNDTIYTVEHYQMDTYGRYESTPYEVESFVGTTNSKVTPSVKTYTGFTSPIAQEINIDGDGLKVLKYYYERNKYTINFDKNGGTGTKWYETTQSVYYGGKVSFPIAVKCGYASLGWYDKPTGGTKYNSNTTWTENKTLYAQYKESDWDIYMGNSDNNSVCVKNKKSNKTKCFNKDDYDVYYTQTILKNNLDGYFGSYSISCYTGAIQSPSSSCRIGDEDWTYISLNGTGSQSPSYYANININNYKRCDTNGSQFNVGCRIIEELCQ